MKSEDWKEIEEIFQGALQRDPAERDAFVRGACHGDTELHREISSLLSHHDEMAGFEPWAAAAAAQLIAAPASLQPGQLLGPYRIESFVAAGGMGQVYRATDTRLNRTVAIKICAGPFSERFAQEARVIASLNHPHICHLYDVGPNYLVMELVEGTPLRGPLPLEQAVAYAGQILDALDTAHRKGITHRDLKPANILVTKQGVKLLDFGLAKRSGPLQETDATRTAALTGRGEILGTLQYMSPEQLQGKEADARSDLFSFGCVLYEMTSGKRAFEGDSTANVIAAILEREPASLDISPPMERVIRTCLTKNPDDRFQNALDLKTALAWAREQPIAQNTHRRGWIAAVIAALAVGALGASAVWRLRQLPADDHVVRFQIALEAAGISGGGNRGAGFALSPDGQTAAFVGTVSGHDALWVRRLDATDARLLRGTEGATRPFWSPDSKSLAFGSRTNQQLQRIDLSQETISKICDVPGVYWGGSWSSDGRILFVIRDVGIFQAPALGGVPSQVTSLERRRVGYGTPQMLPGGRFLYTLTSMDSPDPAIYAASLANPADKIRLLPNASQAQYASADNSEDYLLWLRDGTLVAQRFNAEGLKFIGEAHSLAEGAALVSAGSRVLLYGPGALRQLKWLDRKGNELGLLGEPGPWAWLHMSLDGRRVATLGTDIKHRGIWLLETNRGVASRLTAGFGLNPIWSPDGKAILWSTSKGISRVDAASGTEEQVMESPNIQTVNDWSRDGRFILYAETSPETARDLWVLPVTRDGRPAPGVKGWSFVRDSFNQANARFSPDTHWVAYQSDESGEWQAYIRSFPEPHEKLQVSTGGGSNPQWGSSSRELFYQSRSGKLMAVTLTPAGASLSASLPRELFPLPAGIVGPNPYEAAADGQRFLVDYPASKPEPLNVIVNWPALLKKGAPAP